MKDGRLGKFPESFILFSVTRFVISAQARGFLPFAPSSAVIVAARSRDLAASSALPETFGAGRSRARSASVATGSALSA